MRDTEREARHGQREKQAPHREPDERVNPGTPESCPEPKADAQPLSHPGILEVMVKRPCLDIMKPDRSSPHNWMISSIITM